MAFFPLGSIKTKKALDENGKPQYYLELDQKITELKINGVVIDTRILDVDRPAARYQRMLKSSKLTPEEYQAKADEFEKGGKLEFVKFDVVAKTKKD